MESDIAAVNSKISDYDTRIAKLNEIMDASFKIDSKSLKQILSDTEAVIKSKIDLIDKESFKTFSLFTPQIENQIDSQIMKNE